MKVNFNLIYQFYEEIKVSTNVLQQLIHTNFLHLYSVLEEQLYIICCNEPVKKNASIARFEPVLKQLKFNLSPSWAELKDLAKIRNCLLHGNGRIDEDHYGLDTKEVITKINQSQGQELITLAQTTQDYSLINLNKEIMPYFYETIQKLIELC